MRRRSFLALSGGFCVCGCAGAVHRLPQIDGGTLSLAQGIESAPEAFIGLLKGRNFGKQLVKLI